LTLVFAHGVSGSSSAWIPYQKIFENKYNLLFYDIRGHGLSKKYPNYEDYEIKNFANDLHDLVSYLHISKFILISNSFAALIALEYLKHWREDVLANVFTSPEIFINEGFSAKIFRPSLKLLTAIISVLPFNPKPRGQVDYRNHQNSTDWDIKRNLADIGNTGLRAQFYTLKQTFTEKPKYDLEKINAPSLIIHGEKDSLVPIKNAIKMSKQIKNCELVVIPKTNHNSVHNAVREMSEAIENFIEKHKNVLK
jgi:pimeloyl-ACP methyl ester carboxylesterase